MANIISLPKVNPTASIYKGIRSCGLTMGPMVHVPGAPGSRGPEQKHISFDNAVLSKGDCSLVRRFYSPKVRKSEIKGSSFRRFVSPKVRKSDNDIDSFLF